MFVLLVQGKCKISIRRNSTKIKIRINKTTVNHEIQNKQKIG